MKEKKREGDKRRGYTEETDWKKTELTTIEKGKEEGLEMEGGRERGPEKEEQEVDFVSFMISRR